MVIEYAFYGMCILHYIEIYVFTFGPPFLQDVVAERLEPIQRKAAATATQAPPEPPQEMLVEADAADTADDRSDIKVCGVCVCVWMFFFSSHSLDSS